MRPTLTYFDFPGGRGEASRLALHIAGVDWVDERVSGDWPDRKPGTPFGGLPVLDVPGKGVLSQSNAILSYLGRQHGLLPDDPFEAARHESLMNAVEDLRAAAATTTHDDDDQTRAAREVFATKEFHPFAANTSAQIRGPFVGGDAISVADLKLYVAMRSYATGVYDHLPTTLLDDYPNITGLMAAVTAHPRVASWLTDGKD